MRVARHYKLFTLTLGALVSTTLSGCFAKGAAYEEHKGREVFGVSVRQTAPQPVYKRTRFVHPPSPLPAGTIRQSRAPQIFPVIQLDLEEVTLEEAAQAIAQTARYSSYCASGIATQKISIKSLGTLDELVRAVAAQANVRATVDHHNREVRFMAGINSVEPRLLDEKVSGEVKHDEHQ